MGKILVAGAAGNLGSRTVEALIENEKIAPDQIIATTSGSPDKIQRFIDMGVEPRIANFNGAEEELVKAFTGVDTMVLISMPFVGERRRSAHKKAIDAAVRAGVNKIIYTSIIGSAFEENDAYEIVDHKFTDKYLLEAPVHAVILRSAQYVEAMVSAVEEAIASPDHILSNNMGDGLMAFMSRDDLARMCAACAAGKGADDAIYYPQGPEAMTIGKLVETANEVLGTNIIYRYVTDEENYAFFDSIGVPRTTEGVWGENASNFPYCSDGMVTFGRAIRLGQMCKVTMDYRDITGREPLSVADVFRNIDSHRVGERVSTDTL